MSCHKSSGMRAANSSTMKTMPFIPELQRWAALHADRAAVVVGEQKLTYGRLVADAATRPHKDAHDSLIALELAPSVELAVAFCGAVLHGNPVMVMDSHWPDAVREALRSRAQEWG